MYYYLFEEPKSLGTRDSHRRVIQITGDLGITGKGATMSSAHTVSELVEEALRKGFSTIVAVGSDSFISEVAEELLGSEVAFGVIPTGEAPLFSKLIGAKSIQESCRILKKRKIKSIGVGVIDPRKYFLTEAEIHPLGSKPLTLETGQFRLQGSFTELVLTANPQDEEEAGLSVRMIDSTKGHHPVKKFAHWLIGRRLSDHTYSRFVARKITITTSEPIEVKVLGKEIAKTPLRARYIPDALKIITAHTTLSNQ